MLTETQRQADFIEQILGLQGEVLAGKHPRIKLPSDVVARHAHLQQNSTHHPATNGFTNGFGPSHTIGPPNDNSQDLNNKPYLNGSTGARCATAPFHFSDGIFASGKTPLPESGIGHKSLQTSEVTMKAEQQLKRQRIERTLKDQYEVRKQTAWSEKDGTLEMSARLDISGTLEKALRLAKHVSGLKVVADRSSSPSDAMHTNSYYSSQDNWSSQGSQSSARRVATNQQQQMKQREDQLVNGHGPGRHNRSEIVQLPQGKSSSTPIVYWDEFFNRNSQSAQLILPEFSSQFRYQESDDFEEGEREESEEYEPPAADELGAAAPSHDVMEMSRRISPPLPATSVVRNHIETPFAPQPERVSPLAFAKMPQVGQIQFNELGHPSSPRIAHPTLSNQLQNRLGQQESPRTEQTQEDSSGSAQGKKRSPRNEGKDGQFSKKRKDRRKRKSRQDAVEENPRRTSKRLAPSPAFEPQIKDEPVSPPMGALSEIPVARRRQPLLVDDDVEMISPRRAEPPFTREYIERPESPNLVPISSRPTYRRVIERDDQDLRRYASLQHARRPYSPQPRITYEEPRLGAASQAYIERQLYREGSIRPTAQTQQLQRALSPAPVYIDDDYAAPPSFRRVPASSAMPPPPARPEVVVDQYGNRYIAAPPEPAYETRRPSVAPAQSRRIESDTNERASTRAPARVVDLYDDEDEESRINARMAPPPSATRYMIDGQGREIEMEHGPNREGGLQDSPRRYREQIQQPRGMERAYSVRPREEERPMLDRSRDRVEMAPPASIPRRQSVVYDETPQGYTIARPTSRVQRSFSVRPSALGDTEYRVPPSPAARASVQPQTHQQGHEYFVRDPAPLRYRAVSVVQDGGAPRGEEWATTPSRMEQGQGRVQYVNHERGGGIQRIQSTRKEYVDDPMEGVDEGYNRMPGRRVEYRY